MLNEHYFCRTDEPESQVETSSVQTTEPTTMVEDTTAVAAEAVSTSTSVDDDIDELLKDL